MKLKRGDRTRLFGIGITLVSLTMVCGFVTFQFNQWTIIYTTTADDAQRYLDRILPTQTVYDVVIVQSRKWRGGVEDWCVEFTPALQDGTRYFLLTYTANFQIEWSGRRFNQTEYSAWFEQGCGK